MAHGEAGFQDSLQFGPCNVSLLFDCVVRWIQKQLRRPVAFGTQALMMRHVLPLRMLSRGVAVSLDLTPVRLLLQKSLQDPRTVEWHNQKIGASSAVVKIVEHLMRFRRSNLPAANSSSRIAPSALASVEYSRTGGVSNVSAGMRSCIHAEWCQMLHATSCLRQQIGKTAFAKAFVNACVSKTKNWRCRLVYSRASSEPPNNTESLKQHRDHRRAKDFEDVSDFVGIG